MNSKIRLKGYYFNRLLDYISTYKTSTSTGFVLIDNDFYNGIRCMKKVRVIQTLNAMEAEGIIEKFPPDSRCSVPMLRLTNYAFLYRYKTSQTKKQFAITTTISIIALIKAFDKECLLLLKLLKQLLK